MHDAGLIITMTQVKGMTQFVKYLFNNPLFNFFLNSSNRKAFLQPECGYDACFSGKLGFAVNMGQNRDKKVYIRNCSDFDGLRR